MYDVLLVAENLGYGGAQKMLTFVANHLDRSRFRVHLLNESSDTPVARTLREDVAMYGHPHYSQKFIKRIREAQFLIKLIKRVKPDVVVSFLDMPNFIATFCGWITGVPTVISERGDPTIKTGKLYDFFWRFEKRAAGAVFQTEGARNCYPEEIRKKSMLIENPVVPITGLAQFEYRDKIKNIAFVGRFETVQKRQDLALKAFSLICAKNESVILNFYGSGPDEESIKMLAKELGLFERVRFHGKTSNPQDAMLDNDMLILTSDYEGIPNVLIEAMSIGMPCVATDCSPGGAALLIQNGENGLLVPRGDSGALADAMLRFITDTELAHACGKQAQQICQRYAPDIIIAKWNDYLESICKQNK